MSTLGVYFKSGRRLLTKSEARVEFVERIVREGQDPNVLQGRAFNRGFRQHCAGYRTVLAPVSDYESQVGVAE